MSCAVAVCDWTARRLDKGVNVWHENSTINSARHILWLLERYGPTDLPVVLGISPGAVCARTRKWTAFLSDYDEQWGRHGIGEL